MGVDRPRGDRRTLNRGVTLDESVDAYLGLQTWLRLTPSSHATYAAYGGGWQVIAKSGPRYHFKEPRPRAGV